MQKMKVYRIELQDRGPSINFAPHIPKSVAYYENHDTPRIPCAPTILGCLRSLQITQNPDVDKHQLDNHYVNLYLYEAYVDVEFLHVPTEKEVFDAFFTGELWIMKTSVTFFKVNDYKIRKHMELPNCAYNRYAITKGGEDEVLDMVATAVVYGDETAFSYIDYDPDRAASARAYAEANRLYQ